MRLGHAPRAGDAGGRIDEAERAFRRLSGARRAAAHQPASRSFQPAAPLSLPCGNQLGRPGALTTAARTAICRP